MSLEAFFFSVFIPFLLVKKKENVYPIVLLLLCIYTVRWNEIKFKWLRSFNDKRFETSGSGSSVFLSLSHRKKK
jgi:hypothetical protein